MDDIVARKNEFERLGCQVVVVYCGTQQNGLTWLQKTDCPFLHLLDQNRVFYRQVGLQRFLKDTVCVKTFVRYADKIVAGTWLPKGMSIPEYPGTDVAVMGGDFIVDSTGKLLYAYHSKNQYDRPETETLLKMLQEHV